MNNTQKKMIAVFAAVPLLASSIAPVGAMDLMTTTSADLNVKLEAMTMMEIHDSAANFLASKNVIVDQSADTSEYNYTSNITRREMLKVAMNISGKTVVDTCTWEFDDLDSDDWGCKYAEAALAEGYIAANAEFRPDDLVTEIESLKMIMQARGIERDANDDWRAGYESKAMTAGVINSELSFDASAKRGNIFDRAALTYTEFRSNVMSSEDKMMDDDDMMEDDKMNKEEDGVMVGGAMMVESKNIVENAVEADNVTTLVAAVKAAGLVDTLSSEGPFTVFAPTNSAFAKLPAGTVDTLLMTENKGQLTDILTYHVVAGAFVASDITDGLELTTVQGEKLMFTLVDGKVMINGSATVEIADVKSSNWVTHVIDTVLMPEMK